MTTPAVNSTVSVTTVGTEEFRDTLAGVHNVTHPVKTILVKSALRPASTNSPRTSSGWRNPTSWSHKRYSHNPTSFGNTGMKHNYNDTLQHYAQTDATDICYELTGNNAYPEDCPSWMAQVANTRAYSALKGQKVNLSVAFAERGETKDLFEGVVKHITSGVKAFKSRNPKEWGQVVRNGAFNERHGIPNKWLELQYGWNPLMQDVAGACQALSKRERDNDAYHAHVTGHVKSELTWAVTNHDTGSLPSGTNQMKVYSRSAYEVTTRLWYELDNPVVASFASLGITNPLELLWERVPYSFVVDWFIPVGNWLSSLDSDFGWKWRAGCQSRFTRLKRSGVAFASRDSGFNHYWNGIRDYSYEGMTFFRTAGLGPPGVGLPHFKNPLSAHHLANALSLLVNVFRR